MRRNLFILIVIYSMTTNLAHAQDNHQSYILEHEKDIAKNEPGTHNGGGSTTGYSFFSKAEGLKMTFRKRILHPGSAIGYHLQKEDEIYYIISGTGEMQMNSKTFPVKEGRCYFNQAGKFAWTEANRQ